jgi:hypothetical protein
MYDYCVTVTFIDAAPFLCWSLSLCKSGCCAINFVQPTHRHHSPEDASLHIRCTCYWYLGVLKLSQPPMWLACRSSPGISGPCVLTTSARGTEPRLRVTMFVQKHYQMKEAAAKKQADEKKKVEQAAPKQEQAKK